MKEVLLYLLNLLYLLYLLHSRYSPTYALENVFGADALALDGARWRRMRNCGGIWLWVGPGGPESDK